MRGDVWLCAKCGKPSDILDTWYPFLLLSSVLILVVLKAWTSKLFWTPMNSFVWTLLGLLTLHFLADYVLSTKRVLEAKKFGTPVAPIAWHAADHALLMTAFLYCLPWMDGAFSIGLGIFEFVTHFLVDWFKGRTNYWFTALQDASRKPYWIAFGADQLAHQVVIILIALASVRY